VLPGEKIASASCDVAARKTSWATRAMVVFWVVAVCAGMLTLLRYSNSPGPNVTSPPTWPANTRILLDSNRPTLVMFAHPRCPCTQASLSELERLVSNCRGQLSAQMWFVKPPGTDSDWTNSVLWRRAAAVPGVTVHCDNDGVECRRFHAETSGHTVLYDAGGNLLFQGGITMSRGHEGDNPGRSAVESIVQHKLFSQVRTSVYGCSLLSTESSPPQSPL
jgi:hypothetical protein